MVLAVSDGCRVHREREGRREEVVERDGKPWWRKVVVEGDGSHGGEG